MESVPHKDSKAEDATADTKSTSTHTRFGLNERIQCIRLTSQYESIPEMQKAWKLKFGTDPPTRKTIMNVNKKFNKTGSVADLNRTGRPKTARTDEKIAQVEAAFQQDPSKSIRTIACELGLSKAAVHRIKAESECSKNGLKIENKKLKASIAELKKELEQLKKQQKYCTCNTDLSSSYVSLPLPVSKRRKSNSGSEAQQNILENTEVTLVSSKENDNVNSPTTTFWLNRADGGGPILFRCNSISVITAPDDESDEPETTELEVMDVNVNPLSDNIVSIHTDGSLEPTAELHLEAVDVDSLALKDL